MLIDYEVRISPHSITPHADRLGTVVSALRSSVPAYPAPPSTHAALDTAEPHAHASHAHRCTPFNISLTARTSWR